MSWLLDVGVFLLSNAARGGRRVIRHAHRRHRLRQRLRGTFEVAGRVETLRALRAPLSQRPVAACRVIIEQRADDGTWLAVFDDTWAGTLELCSASGRIRLEGPTDLMVPRGDRRFGPEVAQHVWSEAPSTDLEDIRTTEYLLLPDQSAHLFGLAALPSDQRRGVVDPYRAASHTDARWSTRPLISAWPGIQLPRVLWRQPELLPPVVSGWQWRVS
jgi:hypothetical protein